MSLTLRFQNSGALPGAADAVPMVGGVLTIGRGEDNDLPLPDPDRTLSKRHCVLEERGTDYIITDISTNGTFLNYSQERVGELPTPLNNGDVITIGPYEFIVEITVGQGAPRSDPFASIAPPLEEGPISHGRAVDRQPTQDFVGTLDDPAGKDGGDFLDDLLGGPAGAPQAEGEAPRPSWDRAVVPEDPLEPAAPLPDTEDPFFKDHSEADFRQGGASAADHAPSASDFYAAPASKQNVIPDDWDDDLLGDPGAPPPAPEPASDAEDPFAAPTPSSDSDPLDEILPAEEPDATDDAVSHPPPRAAAVPAADVLPAAPTPPPAGEADKGAVTAAPPQTRTAPPLPPSGADAAAARAFLSAAGVETMKIPDDELTEIMARLGGVFREMVGGIREILMTRASIKGEFRMNQTMIRSGGNNPLKFSINADQALEAMIKPPIAGYQDARTATDEALRDIRAHEVAMMSGMEAALKDLLTRLDPERLTDRIEASPGLGGLLKGKKARYWETYTEMYADIAQEAEDDFQSVFGREFARAYEEQLKKL
ncbi:MAG: type VI secretion system-associated FHA domain protein TagH [Pseudomonadota bacterium]